MKEDALERQRLMQEYQHAADVAVAEAVRKSGVVADFEIKGDEKQSVDSNNSSCNLPTNTPYFSAQASFNSSYSDDNDRISLTSVIETINKAEKEIKQIDLSHTGTDCFRF